MAQHVFKLLPAYRQGLQDDSDGNRHKVELSSLPRPRTPSNVSRCRFSNGDNPADEALFPDHGSKHAANTIKAVTQTSKSVRNRLKRHRLQGWRFGVTVSAWTAFTVLLLNIILTIYAGVSYPHYGGMGLAFEGKCSTVNSWTTWLHVLINGLSYILLSASNYTMQCLCSPTRKEIDQAHARGDWLDIGVPSVRNIWRIDWLLPYFKSLAANQYDMLVVNEDFLQGNISGSWSEPLVLHTTSLIEAEAVQRQFTEQNAYMNDTMVHNMTNADCMQAYGSSFVSDYLSLLASTSAQGNYTIFHMDAVYYGTVFGDNNLPYHWICLDKDGATSPFYACDLGKALGTADDWTIAGQKIDYCLAAVSEPHCQLRFSIQILATVIVMNACKCICMFLTLRRQRVEPLVTVGDAISSLLNRPDRHTKGRCLMAKVDIHRGPLRWMLLAAGKTSNTAPLPVTYCAPLQRRWFAAASTKRWLVTMFLCIAALIIAGALLGIGVQKLSRFISSSDAFSMGFGSVDAKALINTGLPQIGSSGLVSAVVLANLLQAIVSFLYLTYNGLFTCMLLSYEYSKYGPTGRKRPLRVTTLHGQQRKSQDGIFPQMLPLTPPYLGSSYFLQLPYKYSIPLIVASATLHWLISQGIFLVRVSVYDFSGNYDGGNQSELGYSCLPILLAILLGTAMLLVAIGSGFRKFASHIPVAGSCSVALAAAAHRPKSDVDAAFLPVQWGDVNSEGTDEIGHCCFTSEEVHDLIEGRMYAGSAVTTGIGTSDAGLVQERNAS
ncbi:hypothetical protein D0866_12777 [Hortaea werneckii]|nr:hypothetical protein D0866_12777 [Hortaea werneckii]